MQVMHDDDNNITICTALYQSFGFFIIMSPAEGLHFSALVYISTVFPASTCTCIPCMYHARPKSSLEYPPQPKSLSV